MRDKIVKVRMTEEEFAFLEEASQRFGMTKSNLIRLCINNISKENSMKIAEIVTRKDIGYKGVFLWEAEDLTEVLSHSVQSDGDIQALANEIISGKEVVLGTAFVSTFRIATAEDIAEAEKQDESIEQELKDYNPPEVEKFRKTLEKLK